MSLLNTIRFIAGHPLNRGRIVESIVRFAKWQVGSRLVPGPIVHEWINGAKFLVRAGETGLTGNIYAGLHDFPDMVFLLHVLRPNDLFVDVGANAGSYTILACAAVGARGYAFEPVPSSYRRLVENMRLNHLDGRVRCIKQAVGARQGKITFTSDSDTTNHVVAAGEPGDNTVTVEVTSLDAVLCDESPSLLKIDVEGYEASVLEGAPETLSKETLHSVIMELNGSGDRYGFDESRIVELMFDHGFRTYSYEPAGRILLSLEGKIPDSGNTLFVRKDSFVLERLRSAPKVSVYGRPL